MSLPTPNDRPGEAVSHLLPLVRNAFLADAQALRLKDRLTAIALTWLALGMFLIGVLNLASATLH